MPSGHEDYSPRRKHKADRHRYRDERNGRHHKSHRARSSSDEPPCGSRDWSDHDSPNQQPRGVVIKREPSSEPPSDNEQNYSEPEPGENSDSESPEPSPVRRESKKSRRREPSVEKQSHFDSDDDVRRSHGREKKRHKKENRSPLEIVRRHIKKEKDSSDEREHSIDDDRRHKKRRREDREERKHKHSHRERRDSGENENRRSRDNPRERTREHHPPREESSRDRGHDDRRHKHVKRERRSRSPRERVRVKQERQSPDGRRRVKQERASPDGRHRDFPRDPKPEKPGPDFKLSGNLAADTNTYRGIVIKYNQPPEARKPREKWRLYPFKGDDSLPMVPLHRSSGYLMGRERRVADIPVDHPSCSSQHAVLQFRLVDITKADGTMGRKVKPYIIDLGSTNGTYLNGKRIDPERYHELREKDVLKFGFSSREYVILHEKSKVEEEEDEGFE